MGETAVADVAQTSAPDSFDMQTKLIDVMGTLAEKGRVGVLREKGHVSFLRAGHRFLGLKLGLAL